MQISAAIGAEAMFFVASVLEGVGLVLVYDIFRIIRRVMKHGNIWISMEDIVYWLFCTISVFLLLYRENDGLMRAFSFLGILLGSVTYYSLFSRFVIKIGVLVLTPFSKIGKKILLFFKKVLKKVYKTIKMGLCKL